MTTSIPPADSDPEIRSPHRDRLLDLAASLAPQLRDEADAGEDNQLLTPAAIQVLRDSGLFKALTPREVGGFHVDPVTEMEIIEEISAIDGSTGWVYWLLAGSTARAASMLPEAAVSEVFSGNGFPLIAFDERPYNNTLRYDGDTVIVDGTWQFGTAVEHADWVVAIGHPDPAGSPWQAPLMAAVVPVNQVRVVSAWDPAGLAATGTVAYQINNAVVPFSHTWPYPPPGPPVRGGSHFVARRAAIKHLGFALGVARTSLEEFTAHAAGRGAKMSPAAATDLARTHFSLEAARALGIRAVEQMWQQARTTNQVTDTSYEQLRATARYVTEVAIEVCGLAVRHADASLIGRQHRIQRNLRDIVVAAAHAEVSATTLNSFGAHLLTEQRER